MALIKINNKSLDGNYGRRNLIINGAMQIWQRGTTSSALTHNGGVYHTADRWGAVLDQDQGSGTLTTTYSQSTDVPSTEAFPYSLKAVVASSFTPSGSDNTALFYHHIETYNANPLGWGTAAAKPATLSYWIKSSVAGTGTLQIRLNDSNQVSGALDGNYYTKFTINQANTWEKKTHLIPANATDGWRKNVSESAIQMYWFFGTNQGQAPTQDAWFRLNNYGAKHADATFNFQATGGDAYITGVQFEVGDTATDFEHRLYNEELRNCQRYYVGAFDTAGDVSSTKYIFGQNFGANSSNVMYQVEWPVQMRGSPQIGIGSSGSGAGTASTAYAGPDGMSLYYTSAGTGNVWLADVTADAEL